MAGNSIFRDPGQADLIVGERDLELVRNRIMRRSVAVAETIPRVHISTALSSLLSGRLYLVAIVAPAGVPIAHITFVTSSTAAVTPTNQWFALYDKNLAKLGVTNDDTTTAWAGNAEKTLTLAAAYTPAVTDLYYLGINVVAATVPTLVGIGSSGTVTGLAPKLAGTSTTGLTDPASAPNTAAAIAGSGVPYAYTS